MCMLNFNGCLLIRWTFYSVVYRSNSLDIVGIIVLILVYYYCYCWILAAQQRERTMAKWGWLWRWWARANSKALAAATGLQSRLLHGELCAASKQINLRFQIIELNTLQLFSKIACITPGINGISQLLIIWGEDENR